MWPRFFRGPRFYRPTITLEQLEERVVFDASVAPAADQAAQTAEQPTEQANSEAAVSSEGQSEDASGQSDQDVVNQVFGQDLNVVLISSALDNVRALSDAAEDGGVVIVYDAQEDGLEDITQQLGDLLEGTGCQISHLAVVSHGDAGVLTLGDGEAWTISAVIAEAEQWNALGTLLTEDARIDLYGCDIGQGETGSLFVEILASTTGAVVWASDDATGNVGNADWILEVRSDDSSMAALLETASLDDTPILLLWSSDGTSGDDTIDGVGVCPDLNAGDGNDTVRNWGTVYGTIYLGVGDDTCYNNTMGTTIGTVTGDIDCGRGNDTVNNQGTVEGNILGEDGSDEINNAGTVEGNISGGHDDDTIDNSGTVEGGIFSGDDDDTIDNQGNVHGSISGGPGSDHITNEGRGDGIMYGGGGDDTILNRGSLHKAIFGEGGDDTITNASSGTVGWFIDGGDGADTILNLGSLDGDILGSSGNDYINNAGTAGGNIDGGDDDDTILNRGNLDGDILGGAGDDTITNALGTTAGKSLKGGSGDDTMVNYGTVGSDILGEEGSDEITNSGTVQGDINAGSGDDTVYFADGPVAGEIYGGDDYDTLHLTDGCMHIVGTAADGSCEYDGNAVNWSEFEELVVDNSAPELDNSGDMTLATIAEDDVNNSGNTVAQILASDPDSAITDADHNSYEGIAITAVDDSYGDWQYSLDNGTTWTDIGTVSESEALLLSTDSVIRFVPDAEYQGEVEAGITFCAWDQVYGTVGSTADVTVRGGDTSFSDGLETASITVQAVNDDPVINDVPTTSLSVDEDQSLTITGITVYDADLNPAPAGNDILQVDLNVSEEGSLTVSASGVSFIDADGTDGTLSFTGTMDQLNDALAAITYTPTADFCGTVELDITVSDLGNYGEADAGVDGIDLETIDIVVKPVEDAPTASNSDVSMMENGVYTFSASDFNFSDPDEGDTLQEVQITGLESVGSLQLNGVDVIEGQVITIADINAGYLTYMPVANEHGAWYDGFTFLVSDGTLWSDADPSDADADSNSMIIHVHDVNQLPESADNVVSTDEDTAYVFSISDFAFSDADVDPADSLQSVMTTLLPTQGTLKLSGVAVSVGQEISAYEIAAGLLTFEPAGDEFGTSYDSFQFAVSDGVAYSAACYTMTIDVNAVNDAPKLVSGSYTVTGITENDASTSVTVAEILDGRGTDEESGSDLGIAIYRISSAGSGNGTWQYWDGSAWVDFGAVSSTEALLLSSTDFIRFEGDSENGETSWFYCYAWDSSSGTDGQKVDVTERGGESAFSKVANKVSITVTSVNDAPVPDTTGGNDFQTITEDDTTESGYTVAYLLGDSISDVDNKSVEGIAIISMDSGNGTWQYRVNGSNVWVDLDVSEITAGNALLLTAEDSLRFVPDGENGTTAGITYVAWDQSAYTDSQGTYQVVAAQGGTNAFSLVSDTATIVVSSVNDAPELDSSGIMSFTAISEDDTGNSGNTVAEIIASAGGDRITDVDTGSVEGIAIISVDDTNGTWQYTTDGGVTWIDIQGVSEASALLLADDGNTSVRFVPDPDYSGTVNPGITFVAWDQTTGSSGDVGVDVSQCGGTTALSEHTEKAYIRVISVNDAPASSGVPDAPSQNRGFDTATYDVSTCFWDVDSSGLTYELGTPTYYDGLVLTALTIDPATGVVTFTNDSNTSGYVVIQVRASDGSLYSDWQTFTFTVNPLSVSQPPPLPEPHRFPDSEARGDWEFNNSLFQETSTISFLFEELSLLKRDTQGADWLSSFSLISGLAHDSNSPHSKGTLPTEALLEVSEQQMAGDSHGWFGPSDELKSLGNTEQVLGLEEFLARLRERQMGQDQEDIRLAFNADDIRLVERFNSLMASTKWPNEPLVGEMVNTDSHAETWLQGKTLSLDLDQIRAADLLLEAESTLLNRLGGSAPPIEERMTRVFDLNEVRFADLLAI